MQQQAQGGTRLNTNSPSSKNKTLVNGLLPIHPSSQSPPTNPSRSLTVVKRSSQIRNLLLIVILTFLFAVLLLITIEFSTIIVKPLNLNQIFFRTINSTTHFNESQLKEIFPIRSFFACIWFYNLLLFFFCLLVHFFIYERRSQTRTALLRELGRIFVNGKRSSSNTLVDYLVKTCLLCLLWYLSCYLLFRSMSILRSSQIIILYSITITLRQVLGWIFLHEQFIGNKIIAHILALSSLLFLAHDDGFRFNRFLLGLAMITSSVVMKSIFEILISSFVKDFTTLKFRIVMINVCFCGTCLLWPFAILFHITKFEPISTEHFYSFLSILTFICALLWNLLILTLPFEYTQKANAVSILLLIPSISLIDYYLLNVKYSSLVFSSIFCSFVGVLLSMIPKEWFQARERTKMKQALGLLNKDPNSNAALLANLGTTTGTSSAFEEIRAQRRIRNALLFNEMKS